MQIHKPYIHGINRIRLKFKVWCWGWENASTGVLIESDWNLKLINPCTSVFIACVLIESDWNLKQHQATGTQAGQEGINRIRLEFKADKWEDRIESVQVLIESDWNLKSKEYAYPASLFSVLIESDWNLKGKRKWKPLSWKAVLIESDWNLKYVWTTLQVLYIHSINRIRLEFKVNHPVL